MKSTIKKLFATGIAVVLLFSLASCGMFRENFNFHWSSSLDWSENSIVTLQQQLKQQGSDLKPEYDKALAAKVQTIAGKNAALWATYGWDGKSEKSAELIAEEKLIVSANLSVSETLLETFSCSENETSSSCLEKLAKRIIASGKQCTKEGTATIRFQGQLYVFAAIG